MLTLLSTGKVGTIKDVNLAPINRGPGYCCGQSD